MIVNLDYNDEIEYLYELRQVTRSLNQYRKEHGLTITDYVKAKYCIVSSNDRFSKNFGQLKKDLYPKTKIAFSEASQPFNEGQLIQTYGAEMRIKLEESSFSQLCLYDF